MGTKVSYCDVGRAGWRGGHTISFGRQFDDVADADINDTEEALVLFLELLLVKDLNGHDTVLADEAGNCQRVT